MLNFPREVSNLREIANRLTQFVLVVVEVIDEVSDDLLDKSNGAVTLPIGAKEELALSFGLHDRLMKIFNENY